MKTKLMITLLTAGFTAGSAFAQMVPLRVDIDASASTDQINIGAGAEGEASIEKVTVGVTIKKTSSEPWRKPVGVELYILATPVHMDAFTVMGVTRQTFKFTQENENTFEFNSPVYSFGETSGNINLGLEYETYLVIVIDDKGKAVETKCGRSLDEKEMALIRKLEIGKIYDKELNIVGTVDQVKDATKKAVPSATDPGETY